MPEILATTDAKVNQAGEVTATQAKVAGNNVIAQTAGVSMVASVTLKPDLDPEPEEIEAGWVQTVVSSRRVAVYQKAGVTVHKNIIGFESVRDAKGGAPAPWYVVPEKLTKDNRSAYPLAEDQPKLQFPARQGDAEVTSLEGSDNFVVSLKVGGNGDLHTVQSFFLECAVVGAARRKG